MKKRLVKKIIFEKYYRGAISGIRFSDLPKDLLEDDIINIEHVEGHYSENNSWGDHANLYVYREREETDEEFEERQRKMEEIFKKSKEERYKQYLKLKEEFEKQ